MPNPSYTTQTNTVDLSKISPKLLKKAMGAVGGRKQKGSKDGRFDVSIDQRIGVVWIEGDGLQSANYSTSQLRYLAERLREAAIRGALLQAVNRLGWAVRPGENSKSFTLLKSDDDKGDRMKVEFLPGAQLKIVVGQIEPANQETAYALLTHLCKVTGGKTTKIQLEPVEGDVRTPGDPYKIAPDDFSENGVPYGAWCQCAQCNLVFRSTLSFDCHAPGPGAPLRCESCVLGQPSATHYVTDAIAESILKEEGKK